MPRRAPLLSPWLHPYVALLGRYPHPPVCGSIGLAIRILAARLLKLQSPNGIVNSISFVSTTNTARSFAGMLSKIVLLAMAKRSG